MARCCRRRLLEEVARVLVPGGRLWLLALNPLAP
jgi:ubiquinone/menaquinone biosynthesis C-methylase UbiE